MKRGDPGHRMSAWARPESRVIERHLHLCISGCNQSKGRVRCTGGAAESCGGCGWWGVGRVSQAQSGKHKTAFRVVSCAVPAWALLIALLTIA